MTGLSDRIISLALSMLAMSFLNRSDEATRAKLPAIGHNDWRRGAALGSHAIDIADPGAIAHILTVNEPIQITLLVVADNAPAKPTRCCKLPVVLLASALPMAVLPPPVVLLASARSPMAVFWLPRCCLQAPESVGRIVFPGGVARSAPKPVAVF